MKSTGTPLPLRSGGSSSRRVREGGSPLRPGADGPPLFCSPLPNLISPFPLSYFSVGRLPCFEANLPLSLGEVPVPERRSVRRRWNSLRSRGQAASKALPQKVLRWLSVLFGDPGLREFRCCPRRAARVPADETLERRDRGLPAALHRLRAEDLSPRSDRRNSV
jgi:hypothetical protein